MRLIEFKVSNFRSFNEEQEIVFSPKSNVTAIFGSNGAGKTNLFLAMCFFKDLVRNSSKYEDKTMLFEPFLLSNSNDRETSFSVELETKKHFFKYFFSIKQQEISNEHLKIKSKSADAHYDTVFTRKSIVTGRYSENGFTSELLSRTRKNSLILTKAYEDNNDYALEVFDWLESFHPIAGSQPSNATSEYILRHPEEKQRVLRFLKNADLFIRDFSVEQVNMPEELFNSLPFTVEFKKNMKKTGYNVLTTHFIYDGASNKIVGVRPFSLANHESNGTQRMYELAFPILDSLKKGNILCIDEFESFLHPTECYYIIDLFKNKKTNPLGAQLIIFTHATQVMEQVSRDNIYLLGKTTKEETVIAKLPKTIRANDGKIEQKYLRNFFGGIPNIRSEA